MDEKEITHFLLVCVRAENLRGQKTRSQQENQELQRLEQEIQRDQPKYQAFLDQRQA